MSPPPAVPGLGELEYLIMLAVMHVGPEGYSVTIRREIKRRTGRDVARGGLYVTLQRLTDKGLLETWLGESGPERGGKAKRHFQVTPEGRKAVRHFATTMRRMEGELAEAFEAS